MDKDYLHSLNVLNDQLGYALSDAQALQKEKPSREMALVITKIQETQFWFNEHQKSVYAQRETK